AALRSPSWRMIVRGQIASAWVGGVLALWLSGASVAEAREPLDLIPAESLLCWQGRPLPDAAPVSDEPSALQTLLELGTRLAGSARGGLDSGTQLGVRAAELFNLMIRYPHALALIDARAKPVETDPQAKRVDRLRGALVVQNRGHPEPFLRLIQKTVNEQTDRAEATLVTKTAGSWPYQELRDQRLPEWAVIAWGHIDGHFVLTVGAGVWPSIAAIAAGEAPSLSEVPWYAAARRNWGRRALIELFVAAADIQDRLDPFLDGRAGKFFRAWDAGNLEQAHWALGLEGRALFCVAHFRLGDETVRRMYADPENRDPRLLATVPAEARYAIYHLPLDRFLRRFFRGLMSIQEGRQRENIERIWAQIQAEHGFDVERNLLAHLGEYIVLHNDPPHPLRLPLAVTGLIEIRDEPAAVRQTIDSMCGAFQAALDQAAAEGRAPPPWNLHHSGDGVWCLQYGLVAGPAWTVTERFIVFSWSPHALRSYLAKVGDELNCSLQ
ncbi:MAG: hypothetical protein KAY37_03970, partial [Phycisphaerae bacterium]|nr:hypothetical protein [Phycisphaerae bacterium]